MLAIVNVCLGQRWADRRAAARKFPPEGKPRPDPRTSVACPPVLSACRNVSNGIILPRRRESRGQAEGNDAAAEITELKEFQGPTSDVFEQLCNYPGAPRYAHFDHNQAEKGLHRVRGDVHALCQLFIGKSHGDTPERLL